MKHIKAIAFDFGFTLAFPVQSPQALIVQTLQQAGISAKEAEIETLRPATGFEQFIDQQNKELVCAAAIWNELLTDYYRLWLASLGLPPDELRHCINTVLTRYQSPNNWRAHAAARSVLHQLKYGQDLKIFIASNWNTDLPEVLAAVGLADYVDGVVCSAACGYYKPHKSLFEAVVQESKVQPHEILFAGDQYEADYLGARSAGMIPLLIGDAATPASCTRIDGLERLPHYLQTTLRLHEAAG